METGSTRRAHQIGAQQWKSAEDRHTRNTQTALVGCVPRGCLLTAISLRACHSRRRRFMILRHQGIPTMTVQYSICDPILFVSACVGLSNFPPVCIFFLLSFIRAANIRITFQQQKSTDRPFVLATCRFHIRPYISRQRSRAAVCYL